MAYNWQLKDWPDFTFNFQEIEDILFDFASETGNISGMLNALPEELKMEAIIDTMVAEAIKTSEIEGEYFSRQDVMSSIRNNLGLSSMPDNVKDKKAQGIGKLMVDVRNSFSDALTQEKLFFWHELVMADSRNIQIGKWRSHPDPMRVVSGAFGKEKVHFEAPPSSRVPVEMEQFIKWFNDTAPGGTKEIKKAPVRSAIAHLYFESVHPFEDGNGRIGRAIAEKALSQTLGRPVLLSLSRIIEANKKAYYLALGRGQTNNDITDWISYFVEVVLLAQRQASKLIDFILKKTKFFDRFGQVINERQLKVINRMFDAGTEGFEGGINAGKYVSIAKTSKATATRDLQHLTEIKALIQKGGGRSISYDLNLEFA
jgi:Fic family protein